MIQFTSVANVNCLYWITSLEPGQQGATRRVIEDLEPFCSRIGLDFELFEPHSAAELTRKLQDYCLGRKLRCEANHSS